MLTVEKLDTRNKGQVRRFVAIPYRLYKNHPQWVPPLIGDVEIQLDRVKHPFYEHSDADFFIVRRDGRDVGRVAALENKPFNAYHHTRQAQFYLFDCEDDQQAATELLNCVFDWARARGLDTIVGPKGFGVVDGYGLLVKGFEHRQMMTMMNYNYPYYQRLIENIGFEKEVDFVSNYVSAETFRLPERVHRIAEKVAQRGSLRVIRFRTKKELIALAPRIGELYNNTFVNNWEYYPLTQREVKFLLDNLLVIADPRLIKLIAHGDDLVGFLFAFPDVSAALQRARGHLLPFGIVHLLLELKRTRWVALNGAGILPEFQGRGGNTLLYTEIEKTMREFHFKHADLTQVAETAVQMRKDLENVGSKAYKNHRVYCKRI